MEIKGGRVTKLHLSARNKRASEMLVKETASIIAVAREEKEEEEEREEREREEKGSSNRRNIGNGNRGRRRVSNSY